MPRSRTEFDKALDRLLVEFAPRLEAAGRHEFDRQVPWLLALLQGLEIFRCGFPEQRVEAAAKAGAALILFHHAISLFFSRFKTSLAR